jgi:hypothetical protein
MIEFERRARCEAGPFSLGEEEPGASLKLPHSACWESEVFCFVRYSDFTSAFQAWSSPPTRWMLFLPLFLAPKMRALSAAVTSSSTVRPSQG